MKLTVILGLIFSVAVAQSATRAVNDNDFTTAYKRAQDSTATMAVRWSSLLRASELAEGDQVYKISEFAKSKDWYMRNASLVALGKLNNGMAFEQAKNLINDKSLVVRSAAADILSEVKNNDNVKKIFSEELDKSYNFNKQASLWIRPQMMKYLTQAPTAADKAFYVKYLHDKDIKVASLSTEALEKITQVRFAGKNDLDVVKQWRDYAKSQKW